MIKGLRKSDLINEFPFLITTLCLSIIMKVGITTTIPIEVVFAAGNVPCDLNNIFINDLEPLKLVEFAERKGLPANSCSWIKGIYSVVHKYKISHIIACVQGDCSNTHALCEILSKENVKVTPFEYPYNRSKKELEEEIKKLLRDFGVTRSSMERTKREIDEVRLSLKELDRLTYEEGKVSGFENHKWLVGASDFGGDYRRYQKNVIYFLAKLGRDKKNSDPPFPISHPSKSRIGIIGVPPITKDLYSFLEGQGLQVVFNEMQRQFMMPYRTDNIAEQYFKYTYPYDVFFRIKDLKTEISKRRIDGIIHYVQSFCFRHLEDRLIREALSIPVLTLEGDRPLPLSGSQRTQIEAFKEILGEN